MVGLGMGSWPTMLGFAWLGRAKQCGTNGKIWTFRCSETCKARLKKYSFISKACTHTITTNIFTCTHIQSKAGWFTCIISHPQGHVCICWIRLEVGLVMLLAICNCLWLAWPDNWYVLPSVQPCTVYSQKWLLIEFLYVVPTYLMLKLCRWLIEIFCITFCWWLFYFILSYLWINCLFSKQNKLCITVQLL